MKHKPDYKKELIECLLNDKKHSTNAILRLAHIYGYKCELIDGVYKVFNNFEWKMRRNSKQLIDPLLGQILTLLGDQYEDSN